MWQNSRSSLLKMQQINNDLNPSVQSGQQLSSGAEIRSSGLKSKLYPFLRRTVIFVLVVLYFGAFAPLGLDFHHDGITFIPALRVASGGMVFRDVFCQYGFFPPVLQGLSLYIGGHELLVMKYFSVLFYAGSAVLLDIIWERFLSARWRDFLLLMYFSLMPDQMVTFHAWSSIFALFFSLGALWLLLKHLSHQNRICLAFSGILTGLTFLSRQPVGFVCGLAIAGALFFQLMLEPPLHRNWKKFIIDGVIAAMSAASVVGAVAVLLIYYGIWDDFILQCFTYVASFVAVRSAEGDWGYLAESLMPFITDNMFSDSIFATLPLFALYWLYKATTTAAHQPEKREYYVMICALAIFACGSWHQYYPVPCVRHLFWGGVPFFGFFVLSIRELWNCTGKRNKLAKILLVLCLFQYLICALPRIYNGFIRLKQAPTRNVSDIPGLRGIKLTRGENGVINYMRSSFDQLPESIKKRGVVNYTKDGLWSIILPDAGFRHPQFINMGKALYPDYDEKIMLFINKHKPVVLSNIPVYLEDYWPIAQCDYMGENYTLWSPSN